MSILQVIIVTGMASLASNLSTSSRVKEMGRQIADSMRELDSVVPVSITTQGSSLVQESKRLVATVEALQRAKGLNFIAEPVLSDPSTMKLCSQVNDTLRAGDLNSLKKMEGGVKKSLIKLVEDLQKKHLMLARQEQIATVTVLRRSLSKLGFQRVNLVEKNSRSIVRAADEKVSIYADVSLAGKIKIDTAGFKGGECAEAVNSLIEKLRGHGLSVERESSLYHGKQEGGELVREAKELFNPLSPDWMKEAQRDLAGGDDLHMRRKRQLQGRVQTAGHR